MKSQQKDSMMKKHAYPDMTCADRLMNVTAMDIIEDIRRLGIPKDKLNALYTNAARIMGSSGDLARRCNAVDKVVEILNWGNDDAMIQALWLRDACDEWRSLAA